MATASLYSSDYDSINFSFCLTAALLIPNTINVNLANIKQNKKAANFDARNFSALEYIKASAIKRTHRSSKSNYQYLANLKEDEGAQIFRIAHRLSGCVKTNSVVKITA